jgi:ribosomal protein L37AE/L43A
VSTATWTVEERMNEVGSEPKCPFCGEPRVSRSSYIRCNPCGVNWLNEEMHLPLYLERDPRVVRREAVHTASATKPTADTPMAAAEA